jgi:hypothetical protein
MMLATTYGFTVVLLLGVIAYALTFMATYALPSRERAPS